MDTCALIREGGLIPNGEEERAKRVCGLSGDIERTLEGLEGVLEATALVSIPDPEPMQDPTERSEKPQISVVVTLLPNAGTSAPMSEEEVARFVASAIPGVSPQSIFVRILLPPSTYAPYADPNTCVKTIVVGTAICSEHRDRIATAFLLGAGLSAVMAALTVMAMLRALRYRQELTRLTTRASRVS